MREDEPAKRAKLDIAEETEEMCFSSKGQESEEDTNAKLRRQKEAEHIAEEAQEETRVQTEKVNELTDPSCTVRSFLFQQPDVTESHATVTAPQLTDILIGKVGLGESKQ